MNYNTNPWDGGGQRHGRRHRRGGDDRGQGRGQRTRRHGDWDPYGPDAPFGLGDPGSRGRGSHRRRYRARRGAIRLAVLALLAEESRNGYQMIQELTDRTDGVWNPSPGSMYPALAQLTDEGLVEPTEESGQRIYQLTEAGREAAAQITVPPWETVAASGQDEPHRDSNPLWHEFGQLGIAVRAASATEDVDLIDNAVRAVATARREIYAAMSEERDRE